MDARTVEVIHRKLDYLEKTLAELEPYLKAGYAEYLRQPRARSIWFRRILRDPTKGDKRYAISHKR